MEELPEEQKPHVVKDYFLPAVLLASLIICVAWFVISKILPDTSQPKMTFEASKTPPQAPVSNDALDALTKNPPPHPSGGISSKKIGTATIVSEGNLSQSQTDRLSSTLGTTGSATTPFDLNMTDSTGQHQNLIDPLKNFFSASLLWTSRELPSLLEIRLVNAGASGWSGMYYGGYVTSGGSITSVTGYIDLNVYYYQNSPYLLEYLEMTLSHEYGHHYTLYNKWLGLNLGYGIRFPEEYYSVRPLPVATTAPDYSKGWANCDAEIIAEDYKYLFSHFKNHSMAGVYGYPSDPGTRNWLLALGQAGSAPAPAEEPAPESPTPDTTPPAVSITSPADGAILTGTINFTADVSDNNSVESATFYLDSQLLATDTTSPYSTTINTTLYANAGHTLKVIGSDGTNQSEQSISVTLNNSSEPDTELPVAQITAPATNPYTWTGGSLIITAAGSDNTGVVKMEFYINDSLVATENAGSISRRWISGGTPAGSYILKARAYDAAGNTGDVSTVINKTF